MARPVLNSYIFILNSGKMTGLKKNQDFQRIYREGDSRADRYLVLYMHCRGDSDKSRLGISVSKKVGNSVVRHRIKRRVKEIYRLSEKDIPKGCDFVVIARKAAAEADYHTLEKSFGHLMMKASKV